MGWERGKVESLLVEIDYGESAKLFGRFLKRFAIDVDKSDVGKKRTVEGKMVFKFRRVHGLAR